MVEDFDGGIYYVRSKLLVMVIKIAPFLKGAFGSNFQRNTKLSTDIFRHLCRAISTVVFVLKVPKQVLKWN